MKGMWHSMWFGALVENPLAVIVVRRLGLRNSSTVCDTVSGVHRFHRSKALPIKMLSGPSVYRLYLNPPKVGKRMAQPP